ncbi:hypothetical protein SMD44_08736 [Streptomyces alboflavus]|uniref:Uncharacterized protein n=1 Tax=Streptomyces alboflavus TaxID=67267 RepID=A0A1Z1WS83_9ACTN|nr:hypothetical protein SMD44_08736 [Streptomyces alboflavus]
MQGEVAGRVTEREVADRAVPAEGLLDDVRPVGLARAHQLELVAVGAQGADALVIRFRVVSCPATTIRRRVPISSWGLSRSPSSSRTAISALVRSSPGCSVRAATTAASAAVIARLAAIASSGPMAVLTTWFDKWCRRSRCSVSTPSSSQITPIGSGSAKEARRSAIPSPPSAASASLSRSSAVSVSIRGRSVSTRRAENALLTRVRRRRWSSPSAVVMPGTVAKVRSGQPSGIAPPAAR